MRRTVMCALGLALTSASAFAQPNIPPELEGLREPRVSELPSQKMLVVEAQGDPRTVGSRAFGLLFQLYYQIPETPKGPGQAAPRARWPVSFDQPRSEWIGFYALPVPESVEVIPQHAEQPGLTASLTEWEYGPTAEILHVGPYDQEAPTIQRLKEYAETQGYVLAGEHEEEYIRGPTMSGPGNPEEYVTILRYKVTRSSGQH
ncbi:MAG: GyrI-like domain-containing protein [Gemmatimonadales bacterium]|jgi:hypothetical protein